jgi:hypothetical protein
LATRLTNCECRLTNSAAQDDQTRSLLHVCGERQIRYWSPAENARLPSAYQQTRRQTLFPFQYSFESISISEETRPNNAGRLSSFHSGYYHSWYHGATQRPLTRSLLPTTFPLFLNITQSQNLSSYAIGDGNFDLSSKTLRITRATTTRSNTIKQAHDTNSQHDVLPISDLLLFHCYSDLGPQ